MEKEEIQSKALAALLLHNRCGIALATGVGKTLVGLQHMAHNYTDYVRFLVVAPKTTIMTTWKEEAVKHNLEYLLDHIKFTTYLSLNKQDLDYDVVYLDEAHSLILESHDPWLSQYNGKILGMTGTVPKNPTSEKAIMIGKYCPIVFKYITDKAISDKILNDYRIVVHSLSLDTNKSMLIEKGGKSWYSSEKYTYDYWTGRIEQSMGKQQQIMRVMRMKAMMEFPSKEKLAKQLLDNAKDKCILFCNTQKQSDFLCSHSYHSNNPLSEENLAKFVVGSITKLAAVQQLSEGVNIKDLKEAIIMHSFSGSSPKAQQKLGRCLRLSINQLATIHILMYKDTIDEYWVNSVLEQFDKTKISFI